MECDFCKWGNSDCKNFPDKCYLCTSRNYYYSASKKKPKAFVNKNIKKSKRMGSQFERTNHALNNEILNSSSFLTPNSGAGKIKGDEEILGLVNISEELKTCETRNEGRKPGTESFTIKKAWLDKLAEESLEAGREFWYLKFAFKNSDKISYVIIDTDIIMSMIATLSRDRYNAKIAESNKSIAEKQLRLSETEIVKLHAEIDMLKEKINNLELILKANNLLNK